MHAAGQGSEVIAAFQHQRQLAITMSVGDILEHAGEHREVIIAKIQRHVVTVWIEPRRDKYQVWLKALGGRNQYVPKRLFKREIAGIPRYRCVHGVSLAKPGAYVLQLSGTGIERRGAMDIEKKYIGIGPENILGAIAVVGIPVDNQDALTAQLRLGMSCCNSDVIDQAKSPRSDRLGMMARRPHQGKGALAFPLHHRLNCGNGITRRRGCRLDAIRRHCGGIPVEPGPLPLQ